jgi:hypothetical protein
MTLASIPTKNNCRRGATPRPRAESQFAGIAARAALLYPSTRVLVQRPGDPEKTPRRKDAYFASQNFAR